MEKGEKRTRKRTEKPKMLTEPEQAALRLVAEYPEKSNYAIGVKLQEKGIVRDSGYLTKRVKKSATIRDKLSILREKNDLRIAKIVPRSIQLVDKQVRAGELKAAKIAIDTHFRMDESKRPVRPMNIEIGQLQVVMQQVFETGNLSDTEVIDV